MMRRLNGSFAFSSIFVRWQAAVLLAAGMVLGGCDAAPGEDRAAAGFTARVTGAVEAELEGRALFATIRKDGADVFGLQLQAHDAVPYVLVSLERGIAARPAPGAYPVVGQAAGADPAAFAATYTRSQEDPFFFEPFHATGGTLVVTRSDAGRLAGSVTFTADAGGGRVIEVSAVFDAAPGR